MSNHINIYQNHIPDVDTIRDSHVKMTTKDFLSDLPHRDYFHDDDEACYLCALLCKIDELQSELDELKRKYEIICSIYQKQNQLI